MSKYRLAKIKYFAICYGGGLALGLAIMGWISLWFAFGLVMR